jgi:hypothetical protein
VLEDSCVISCLFQFCYALRDKFKGYRSAIRLISPMASGYSVT